MSEHTAVVELDGDEARRAKIAARKEDIDTDSAVIEQLDRAFSGSTPSEHPDGTMRFEAPAEELCRVAMAIQRHGKQRREQGHTGSSPKYYSIGHTMESQLVRQGAWTEASDE